MIFHTVEDYEQVEATMTAVYNGIAICMLMLLVWFAFAVWYVQTHASQFTY